MNVNTNKSARFLPSCVLVSGCQHSGSAQHGAEACAREQMVVTRQEGSGGTARAQPNPRPWLLLPVGEGKVAPAAQCWREMEGGQLLLGY